MNAAVMPSRSEKITSTVRSSSSVTPERAGAPCPRERAGRARGMPAPSVRCTYVVLGSRLAVLPHAAELELVGVGVRLGGRIRLGQDAVLFAVLGEAVLFHGRLGFGVILVVHVDQDVAELVDPFAQLIVAEV